MSTGTNRILNGGNAALGVTSAGMTPSALAYTFEGLPLGTVGNLASGQLCLKVKVVEGPSVSVQPVSSPDTDSGAYSQFVFVGGGKSVTSSTYSPAYSDGLAAAFAIDGVTGRLLVNSTITPNLPATAFGTTQQRILTANSTAVAIKASSGNLYAWNIINGHSAVVYVKFYNVAAASVNAASSIPILTVAVAASGGMVSVRGSDLPKFFSTAISVRAVTDFGDTGTTAPGTLPIIEVEYV